MSGSRPVIAHPEEGMPGQPTPDMERRESFERDGRWASWIRNDAGDVSGWHHHAANDTYVYVSRGSLTIHFGPGGAESIEARRRLRRHSVGDGPSRDDRPGCDLDAFVIRVGGDLEHVNVDGPED